MVEFKSEKYGLRVTRELLAKSYPDPLRIESVTDAQIQSALDNAEKELIKAQYTEEEINDYVTLGWGEFVKKHPYSEDIDYDFFNELEVMLVREGCKYVYGVSE